MQFSFFFSKYEKLFKALKIWELEGNILALKIEGSNNHLVLYSWLIVSVFYSYMFWRDWEKPARIGRAGMDGSSPRSIVQSRLSYPNGLTVVRVEGVAWLYWIDPAASEPGSIQAATLDGALRKVGALCSKIFSHLFNCFAKFDETSQK